VSSTIKFGSGSSAADALDYMCEERRGYEKLLEAQLMTQEDAGALSGHPLHLGAGAGACSFWSDL